MNALTDAELVRRVPGDPAAYEELYLRHVARVRRFAARRCSTPEDVADAVADTFLAILRAAPRYEPRRGEVLPWMLGIAATTIAGERRRLARRRALERRVSGRALLDADDRERIESEIDAARLAPRLDAALDGAPPRERELFLLVSQEGLGVSEAGRALGISAPAARARMARARRRLRAALDDPAPSAPATARPEEPA